MVHAGFSLHVPSTCQFEICDCRSVDFDLSSSLSLSLSLSRFACVFVSVSFTHALCDALFCDHPCALALLAVGANFGR